MFERILGVVELVAGIGMMAAALALAAASAPVPRVVFLFVGAANTVAGILTVRQQKSARIWSGFAAAAVVCGTWSMISLTAWRPPFSMTYLLFAAAIQGGIATWLAAGPNRQAGHTAVLDAGWRSRHPTVERSRRVAAGE